VVRRRAAVGAEHLFVSRANIARRRLVDEATLHDGLRERGFSVFHPETSGDHMSDFTLIPDEVLAAIDKLLVEIGD
jgi:capsular polysaccharide biosynthesis protein